MKKSKIFKITFGLVFFVLSILFLMTSSCFHLFPSVPNSLSRSESIRRNAFICDYVPTQDSIIIDNRKICLPIKAAFAENHYSFKNNHTYKVDLIKDIQVVAVFSDTLKLSREDYGDYSIQGRKLTKKNRVLRIKYFFWKGSINLPDSIPCYITNNEREVTTNGEKHYTSDTLQTFWLVKKTLPN